jgi:hypothetical protein
MLVIRCLLQSFIRTTMKKTIILNFFNFSDSDNADSQIKKLPVNHVASRHLFKCEHLEFRINDGNRNKRWIQLHLH